MLTHNGRLKFGAGGDAFVDIVVERPGVYTYLLSAQDETEAAHAAQTLPAAMTAAPANHHHGSHRHAGDGAKHGGSQAYQSRRPLLEGHLVVSPTLRIRGLPLPLDGINLLTVVPKWMGTISEWLDLLAVSARAGYNVVHFVPMQERGVSNSPYSIRNQTVLALDNYAPNTPPEEREKQLATLVDRMEHELGMISLADVVWNHTAIDSPWLLEHPEAGACWRPASYYQWIPWPSPWTEPQPHLSATWAGYNLENSPHLKAAFILDTAILDFSVVIEDTPLATLRSPADLDQLMAAFQDRCLKPIRLWEFFTVDVHTATHAMLDAVLRGDVEVHSVVCTALSFECARKAHMLKVWPVPSGRAGATPALAAHCGRAGGVPARAWHHRP